MAGRSLRVLKVEIDRNALERLQEDGRIRVSFPNEQADAIEIEALDTRVDPDDGDEEEEKSEQLLSGGFH